MSATRRLKPSFHHSNHYHHENFKDSSSASHFHNSSSTTDVEKEILNILSNVSHIKGKTLYQTIASLKNEAHPSRPLKSEINQIVWKLHADKKISLAEHPEKRGLKYATIQGFKTNSFNPKDAELLIEIVNMVPPSKWAELGQMSELGNFRKALCLTVGKIRQDKVKILSHKQCYWALESLKFAMEEGLLLEDWSIENLSLDYSTLSVLLSDLRHFQD